MISLNCNPSNTLIIEDSKIGYQSALGTRADILRVSNSHHTTLHKIKTKISTVKQNKTKDFVKFSYFFHFFTIKIFQVKIVLKI